VDPTIAALTEATNALVKATQALAAAIADAKTEQHHAEVVEKLTDERFRTVTRG
jgi:hypothetical protein